MKPGYPTYALGRLVQIRSSVVVAVTFIIVKVWRIYKFGNKGDM